MALLSVPISFCAFSPLWSDLCLGTFNVAWSLPAAQVMWSNRIAPVLDRLHNQHHRCAKKGEGRF